MTTRTIYRHRSTPITVDSFVSHLDAIESLDPFQHRSTYRRPGVDHTPGERDFGLRGELVACPVAYQAPSTRKAA